MTRIFVEGTKPRRPLAKSRPSAASGPTANQQVTIDEKDDDVTTPRTSVAPTLVDGSGEDGQQRESTFGPDAIEASDDEVVQVQPQIPAKRPAPPEDTAVNRQATAKEWERILPRKPQPKSAPKRRAAKQAAKKASKASKVKKEPKPRKKNIDPGTSSGNPQTPPSRSNELETPGAGPSSTGPTTPKKRRKAPEILTPRTPRTPSQLIQESRAAKDKRYRYRSWLYKTEVIDWHKYNLATSDLVAIPALVQKNTYHEEAKDTQCYRVRLLNWLQEEINAEHGLFLPEDSLPDKDAPEFAQQNGENLCKEDAYERFHTTHGLLAKQLDRLKPSKVDRANKKEREQRVNHWNVVDIEALLQQGANLIESCPAVPDICQFDEILTRDAVLKSYGFDENDLSQIEASGIETDDHSGIVTYAEYNLWDVLQLKASLEANEAFNNLTTQTQARKDFKVSYRQLESIGVAHRFENTPHKDSFVTYYRVSDLEALIGPRPEGEPSAAEEDEPQSNAEKVA